MLTHDKNPGVRAARAFKEKLNRCLANRIIYRLFDAILGRAWDALSQEDGQALFRVLNGYLSGSRLYQHVIASFLRYHAAHDPANQDELKALEKELQEARQAQADAEFAREALEKQVRRQCEIWRLILDADSRSELQPLDRLEVFRVWQEASLLILEREVPVV